MYQYSKLQTFWLVALRVLIGWHFLYEGLVKLINPKWSAMGYLMDSQGWFASWFQSMASNLEVLNVVNILNEWGLIFIGLGLIFGCFAKLAGIGGILIMGMYYLSHPPFIGSEDLFLLPREGAYLWVDRNLLEIAALAVLCVFPTSKTWGLDKYISQFFKSKQ
jgi:thiosulfate dehydrogenase [quinone] large subunit